VKVSVGVWVSVEVGFWIGIGIGIGIGDRLGKPNLSPNPNQQTWGKVIERGLG